MPLAQSTPPSSLKHVTPRGGYDEATGLGSPIANLIAGQLHH